MATVTAYFLHILPNSSSYGSLKATLLQTEVIMHNPPRITFSVFRGLFIMRSIKLVKNLSKTCMKLMRGGHGWERQTVTDTQIRMPPPKYGLQMLVHAT